MKTLLKLLLISSAFLSISCTSMFGDLYGEFGTDYNYFLAVVNGLTTNRVAVFSLDSAGTAYAVSRATTAGNVSFSAVHPSGDFLYVVSRADHTITAYTIAAGGTLAQLGSIVSFGIAADDPERIRIDPTGKYLYITSSYDGISNPAKVFMFKINSEGTVAANGSLGVGEYSLINLTIGPSGSYLFIAREDPNDISRLVMYRIGSDGKLTEMSHENSSIISNNPKDIKIHPSNKFVYITSQDNAIGNNHIYRFQFSDTGIIYKGDTNLGGTSGTGAGVIEIHPSGNYLYASSPAGGFYSFSILSDGSLQETGNIGISSSGVIGSTIHPKDNYIFISNQTTNTITRISINSDGTFGTSKDYSVSGYTNYAWGLALIRKKK